MRGKEETTVSGLSVGADMKQPLSNNNYDKSIADMAVQGNLQVQSNP